MLAQAAFDEAVETICAPCYAEGGRPSMPPGLYFRMILVGYFEGIDSQRGIAWRCADSPSLRSFLWFSATDNTPVHASRTEARSPLETQTCLRRRESGKLGPCVTPPSIRAKMSPREAKTARCPPAQLLGLLRPHTFRRSNPRLYPAHLITYALVIFSNPRSHVRRPPPVSQM